MRTRPAFDDPAGLRKTSEQMLIEAFIAQTPNKALCKAILHRLAWRDVMPLDSMLLLPLQDSIRGELGAVVADDEAG